MFMVLQAEKTEPRRPFKRVLRTKMLPEELNKNKGEEDEREGLPAWPVILRFFATWRDETFNGETRHFRIHFYR